MLREMAGRHSKTVMGAELARTVMKAVASPFFHVEKAADRRGEPRAVIKQIKEPDPDGALRFTESALKVFRATKRKSLNLAYDDLVRQRAECKETIGDAAGARTEVQNLRSDLANRGVNQPVLAELDKYAASFSPSKKSSRKRPARKGRRTR